jgi:hypothetical protein
MAKIVEILSDGERRAHKSSCVEYMLHYAAKVKSLLPGMHLPPQERFPYFDEAEAKAAVAQGRHPVEGTDVWNCGGRIASREVILSICKANSSCFLLIIPSCARQAAVIGGRRGVGGKWRAPAC